MKVTNVYMDDDQVLHICTYTSSCKMLVQLFSLDFCKLYVCPPLHEPLPREVEPDFMTHLLPPLTHCWTIQTSRLLQTRTKTVLGKWRRNLVKIWSILETVKILVTPPSGDYNIHLLIVRVGEKGPVGDAPGGFHWTQVLPHFNLSLAALPHLPQPPQHPL